MFRAIASIDDVRSAYHRAQGNPQYILHPLRLARRLARPPYQGTRDDKVVRVQLPWGVPLTVDSYEAVSYSIRTARIFDPCVSEVLTRLLDPGEHAVDA